MGNEIEATFYGVDKDALREKLREQGATLIQEEVQMKRRVYDTGDHSFARVRDEGNKIVMTYKNYLDDSVITGCKEVNLVVDNYEDACNFLIGCGMKQKAEQITLSETCELDGVEICIDTWPRLPTYVEIEGDLEDSVWNVAKKLGFKKEDAHFGSVDTVYNYYYGVEKDVVNSETPVINFEIEAPDWAKHRVR